MAVVEPPVSSDLTTTPALAFTLTSAVSRWQFLQERPMPEKARSGLSNLFSLALRKNVEKGSCGDEKWTLGKRAAAGSSGPGSFPSRILLF